ncbi:tyrosine-type recombinase/integrase [Mycetocola spongiae]|uniref:tyrosine-type recombinase/integrase n=1 Tax=Mycetocola spongiae TaxID=2859226 RepID=UPI001CF0DF52|nr:tyrosine-type recombinase/integrase [Mycetocola spongiae]
MPAPEILDYLTPYAPRTQENYFGYLARWESWCASRSCDILTAQRADIEAWVSHLRNRGLSNNAVRSALTPVTGFYRWASEQELVTRDPARFVRRPPAPRSSNRDWLSAPDLAKLLRHVTVHSGIGISAAIHLFALSGTRPGETMALDISDIGRYGDLTTLRLRHRKAGASDKISLSAPTARAVRRAADGRSRGPLLVTETNGYRLTKTILRARFAEAVASAGVPRITPYGLRVGFITLALDAGIPERDVMISAGHSNSAQTAHYDRLRGNLDRNATHALTEWILAAGRGAIAGI